VSRREALASLLVLPAAASAASASPAQAAALAQVQPPDAPAVAGPSVTAPLAKYVAGARTAQIPEDFRELARRHILDTLASVVACRDLIPATLARDYSMAQSGGASKNAATILGTREKAALVDAVFASAMTAHAAEINDFIPSAFVQPGPSIVSASIALAEVRGGTGDDILRAVITGYELAGRFPKALGIANLRRANIANHGIGPVWGTAAAAAVMLNLREDRMSDLFTYCAQQSSGSYQWLMDVEHIEKAFVFGGMGARNGLQAALMVEAGFRGVRDSLDHPDGWMRSLTFRDGDSNRAYLIEGLGQKTELVHTAFKKYPSGGPAQPAVQGMLALLPQIDRQNVASVLIEMPGRWQAFRDAAMPALNLRYLTAIILLDGRLDFTDAQSLDRMANDESAKALMKIVDVVHDPKQEVAPGEERKESAWVRVTEKSGRKHEIFVPYVVGYPSHPFDKADVETKALELMTPRLGERRAKDVVAQCWSLDTLKSGGSLATLIAS
jgi:2-methylcitrate dehydratase PrpD